MTENNPVNHIYRVAKFIVPATARSEFLANANRARAMLKKQPGFVQDTYLEQRTETGDSNIVTIAEWQSQADMERATGALMAYLKSINFNPQETNLRLGVQSEAGFYRQIDDLDR